MSDWNKIGIIGAMGEEVSELIALMEHTEASTRAGMEFYEGTINGKDVVVVQSGIGKVNMAMCAQILADCYAVDCLINTGVAGALDARLRVGDIVIARDAVQHDMDVTALGDPLGQVPRMDVWAFPADEKLAEIAYAVNKKVNPDVAAYMGRVVSGDQFIGDPVKKEALIRNFDGTCCEMEGAAMAQTAYRNEIPCLILRAISDQADGGAQVSYETFLGAAVANLMRVLREMLIEM